jgi:hypothetical protein
MRKNKLLYVCLHQAKDMKSVSIVLSLIVSLRPPSALEAEAFLFLFQRIMNGACIKH